MIGRVHLHYKGGRYFVLTVAETHEHNGDKDVVYISLTHGGVCTRPLGQDSRRQDSWTDVVGWPDNVLRSRFVPEDEFSEVTLLKLRALWAARP